MTLADLKRKPVVSMSDGTKVGDVDDLVIDVARWEVSELIVVSKTGHGLLPLTKLKSIGPDAVVVETLTFIDWNVKSTGLAFHDLKALTVVDGSGTVVVAGVIVIDLSWVVNGRAPPLGSDRLLVPVRSWNVTAN